MRRVFSALLAIALCFAGFSRASATSVAETTFYFTGDCTDCSNPLGVLVLQGYTPGSSLSDSNFVSFDYSSSVVTDFSLVHGDFLSSFGGSIGYYPGSYEFTIGVEYYNAVFTFETGTDGDWSFGTSPNPADFGTDGTFSMTPPTPEPSSLYLLGTGIAAVGALRRRFVRELSNDRV